jgi:hypothetical protein
VRRIVSALLTLVALGAATIAIQPGLLASLGGVRLQASDATLIAPAPVDHSAHLGGGSPVQPPAAVPAPNAARVEISVAPAEKASRGYVLGAHVSTPDGRPAGSASVTFYDVVDLLGTREMLVGTATADGRGDASLDYLPATAGTHQIVARTAGIPKTASGEARTTLDAAIAAPPYHAEVPGIAAFQDALPYGVGVVLVCVWSLIAFALVGTARGVARGARAEKEKGVLA